MCKGVICFVCTRYCAQSQATSHWDWLSAVGRAGWRVAAIGHGPAPSRSDSSSNSGFLNRPPVQALTESSPQKRQARYRLVWLSLDHLTEGFDPNHLWCLRQRRHKLHRTKREMSSQNAMQLFTFWTSTPHHQIENTIWLTIGLVCHCLTNSVFLLKNVMVCTVHM